MNEDRSSRALARIEQALARLEAVARRPAPPPAAPAEGAELAALKVRHNRLRGVVQESLQQLDLLIEGTQG